MVLPLALAEPLVVEGGKCRKASALEARGSDFRRPRPGAKGEGERARRVDLWSGDGYMIAAAAAAAPLGIAFQLWRVPVEGRLRLRR